MDINMFYFQIGKNEVQYLAAPLFSNDQMNLVTFLLFILCKLIKNQKLYFIEK